MASQQQAIFDGFSPEVSIFEAEYTVTDGISPGYGTMVVAPENGTINNIFGTLTLGIGGNSVSIQNIVILDPQMAADTGGKNVFLQFADCRIWWQFGEISGLYNTVKPDNTIEPGTEKTPQELAILCLDQMPAVTGYDVSAMPNDLRPEVTWAGANPAQELANICDQVNCRVAWWIDGTVKIVRSGQGALLDPTLPSESRSQALTIKPTPDKIRLYGTEDLYEVLLPLEAVGLETDGRYVPVNDLTYMPASTWLEQVPTLLSGVSTDHVQLPDGSTPSLREIALSCVYRCYRIKDDLTETFAFPSPPGFSTPSGQVAIKRKHLLPMQSDTLASVYTDADGAKHPKDSFIVGVWCYYGAGDFNNCYRGSKLNLSFSTDLRHGVITLAKPVFYRPDTENVFEPAQLWWRVAVRVKDPKTREPLRYKKSRDMNTPPIGTGVQVLRAEDVKQWFEAEYLDWIQTSSGWNPILTRVFTNTPECDTMAKYYLDAAQQFYDRPDAAQDQIPWIADGYRIDGAIRQISWRVSVNGGATTNVSRGTQHDPQVPSWKERRRKEMTDKAEVVRREVLYQKQVKDRGGF